MKYYMALTLVCLSICLAAYFWPSKYKVSPVNMEEWQKQHERCRSGPTAIEVFVLSDQSENIE